MDYRSNSTIKAVVEKIKQEVFLGMKLNPYSLISIPADLSEPQPMFENCLNWVVKNQKKEGFWGEFDGHGNPTLESLPATIACMVALKRWNVGHKLIARGMEFIEAKGEEIIGEMYEKCPSWFAIIFPAMIELAHSNGLQIVFSEPLKGIVMEIFYKRQQILHRENATTEKSQYPPLMSYLEAMPDQHNISDEQQVVKNLDKNGSLFQSPSATARAFMATRNIHCLHYLQSLVQNCPNGVPATYPVDEDLIYLCFTNHLQRLGLAEHFDQEIEQLLQQIYRNYMNQDSWAKPMNSIAVKLYKDSLAFWLLRLHGYNVSPCMNSACIIPVAIYSVKSFINFLLIFFPISAMFCWFLHDEEMLDQMQKNHEYFSSAMLNVYKATDLMFPGEFELEEAKSFSRKLLEKSVSVEPTGQNTNFSFPNFHALIKHELKFPWLARLDHLEHRMWIEEQNSNALWMGKASFHRFSSYHNDNLMQLAIRNYEFRQSIYLNELNELKRWSRRWGLSEMGFGREKTTYCYFAVSASTSLPQDSDVRLMVAKSATIITVADDFYDMEGSLHELKHLTFAIKRWDGKGLSGHSRTIFNVLDDLITEMAAKYLQQQGKDITNHLRSIWNETFSAWLLEAKWSRSGYIPTAEEYIETGMLSIAARDLLLPASCFLNPSLPVHKLNPPQLESITQLAMLLPRLLNDMQSYEKEEKDGKINFVLLHSKQNPESNIEDSIAYVKAIVDEKKREFIKHALMADGSVNDLPKQFRQLHLSCLKVFQMFFDSTNRYDSTTEMISDIQKAIYLPLQNKPLVDQIPEETVPIVPVITRPLISQSSKRYQTAATYHFDHPKMKNYRMTYAAKHALLSVSRNRSINVSVLISNFRPCII